MNVRRKNHIRKARQWAHPQRGKGRFMHFGHFKRKWQQHPPMGIGRFEGFRFVAPSQP